MGAAGRRTLRQLSSPRGAVVPVRSAVPPYPIVFPSTLWVSAITYAGARARDAPVTSRSSGEHITSRCRRDRVANRRGHYCGCSTVGLLACDDSAAVVALCERVCYAVPVVGSVWYDSDAVPQPIVNELAKDASVVLAVHASESARGIHRRSVSPWCRARAVRVFH